ncbi:MAG: hypothetical protein JWN03_8558 [Nocardia sp.]|uniref:hypothetical protein n=1 Tax=Nocardia sp. TaxID=1821 RepID=UPI0026233CC8|nr:hypothetical protein [Nocardia sp.]MCU1648283.1 hypothetical protein [Nocardia sp.]
MRIVFVAASEVLLDPWREALGKAEGVEFKVGAMPDVAFGCDAILIPGIIAHDRYGGIGQPRRAQILENLRGDGNPDLIVASPNYSNVFGADGNHARAISSLREVFLACFQAVEDYNSGSQDHSIESVAVPVAAVRVDGLKPKDVASAFAASIPRQNNSI